MKVSGLSIIQNGISAGYPILESFLSIEPIIDEYVIVEGYSNDGTFELLKMMEERWEKITIVRAEWPLSVGGATWSAATNLGKSHCKGEWILYAQPDEIWHPEGIKELAQFYPTLPENVQGIVVPLLDVGQNFQRLRKDDGMTRMVRNLDSIVNFGDSMAFSCQDAVVLDMKYPPVNLGWAFPINGLRKIINSRRYHEEGQDTPLSVQAKIDLALRQPSYRIGKVECPFVERLPPILYDLIGEPEYYVRSELLAKYGLEEPKTIELPDFYPNYNEHGLIMKGMCTNGKKYGLQNRR